MGFFRSLGGVFTAPPAVVPWGNADRFLFVFAVGPDQALWYTQLDGLVNDEDPGAWSEWKSLGGVVTSAPCAVRSGESGVDVFAAGAHSELLHWEFRDGAWTRWPVDLPAGSALALAGPVFPGLERNWEALGGILTSPPSATTFGENNGILGVFVRGTDHGLWVKSFDGGAWQAWDTLGHTLRSAPHAVTWERETLAVFALGTDSAIWYTMGSTEWHSLGGSFSSAPYALATWKHIHVFARDQHSVLRHCSWDGSSWTGWESLGGILMSRPTANGFERGDLLHVFALGTDSAIWRRRWVGDSWTDWHSLGGPFLSPPATITRIPDSLVETRDLAGLRTDHAVWHMEEDDS